MERVLELEIWQDGVCVAGVYASEQAALQEARHYAAIYGQDGPVEVFRYVPRTGKREPFNLQPNTQ